MYLNYVQIKSTILGYIIKRISILTVIIGVTLFSVTPIFADGDGNVYFIPPYAYQGWEYWIDHLTNDFQIYQLDNSGINIQMTRSDVNVYVLTAYAQEGTELNRIVSNIEDAGGTVTSTGYSHTDSYGRRIYQIGYTIPKFNEFNTNSGYEQNYLQNIYMYPHIEGQYSCKSSYNANDRIFLRNEIYVFAFYTNTSCTTLNFYGSDGTNFTTSKSTKISQSGQFSNFDVYTFTPPKAQSYTLSFSAINGSNNMRVYPVYFGLKKSIPDDVAALCEIDTKTNTLLDNISTKLTDIKNSLSTIISGNTNSQNAVSDLSNNTSNFTNTVDDVESMDNLASTKLDDSMSNINTNDVDLITNGNFVNSMNWVSRHYSQIINNTPISKLLVFSLVIGLALTIIGKVRSR